MSSCCPRELEDDPLDGEEGLFMNQRMAKKPTRATAMIWGRLMEVCWGCAMVAIGSVCAQWLYGVELCSLARGGCGGEVNEVTV